MVLRDVKKKGFAILNLMTMRSLLLVAAQALARETFPQDVDYAALRARLVEKGLVL